MPKIRRLIWDRWNIAHIARHNVDPEEVEYVVQHNPLFQRGEKLNRLVLVGATEEQRILAVPLHNRGEGRWYPLTAYDASDEDKALYKRKRGGGKDEEEK